MSKKIIIFGNGYVSSFLTKELDDLGWIVVCASRKVNTGMPLTNDRVTIINFFDPSLIPIIQSSNVVLSTVPPDNTGADPVLQKYGDILSREKFEWVGYLSSTSVYGNHDGSWVDEKTECSPSNEKARKRLLIENKWLDLYARFNLPVHILRLSGIYGPGRNCLEDILMGKDSTVVKQGHYFSRIHIEDICQAIIASMQIPTAGEIYNLSDEEPTPLYKVQQFGAKILSKNKLREILEEEADLSEQAKMFFQDNKKVNSNKIAEKLRISWQYPNYRLGLLNGCLPHLKQSY